MEPEQMSLLDQAQHRADVAVETVESHMTEEQRDWWIGVVWETARKYQEFSTNAVIEMERKLAKWATEGGETYPVNLIERRALGAVMRRAAKIGVVRPTDRFEPDRTPGAHARPKRIWRSLVWRG